MASLMRGWLTLLVFIFAATSAAAEPKRVLLLHSFGPQFVPWVFFAGQFREELFKQSPDKIDLYEASLEGSRFSTARRARPNRRLSCGSFRDTKARLDRDDWRSSYIFYSEISAKVFSVHSTNHRCAGAASDQLRHAHVE